MAQFRTTADIMDLALANAGEVTNGNSSYETQLLNYLNRAHMAIVSGGTIPIGKDQTVEIDETWTWAKAKGPLIIELQPKYDTGTVTLTQGSEAGTFSSGPSASLQGYHIQITGRPEWFKIASHTAAATAFELDGAYPDTTGSGLSFVAAKLDYTLIADYIVVNDSSNRIQFQKTAGSTLTGSLTNGVYTPSDLATHVAAIMTTAAAGPTITGAYSSITRKFTFTSDGAGSTTLIMIGNGSQANVASAHRILGFDDEASTAGLAQESVYVRGGISRLVEPFRIHKGVGEGIFSVDSEAFHRDYPLSRVTEQTPDRFCVLSESADGILVVRFNGYPSEKTRVEIENVPVPKDLKDNSSSIPLIPRKHSDVLEDAATFYLMLCKSDDRAQAYANLLQGKLKAMIAQHRGSLLRAGENFGQIIPRLDKTRVGGRRYIVREPY